MAKGAAGDTDGGRPAWFERCVHAMAPLTVLVVLAIVISLKNKQFLTVHNLANVLLRNVALALIAIGETVVIIAGQIDLGVGSVMALCAVTGALGYAHGQPLSLAVAEALVVGALAGWVNGIVTAKARMPAFIVTLAMMGLARGLTLVVTGARTVDGPFGQLEALIDHQVLGVPVAIWLLLVAAVGTHLLLACTVFGRSTYASGSNPVAARLSGIRVDRGLVLIFCLNGVLVALAGLCQFMQNTSAEPTMGMGLELDAIAAVVIGGASLSGGQGGVAGTLLGVAIMAVLHNGCNLIGIPNQWEKVVIGPLIVLAVLYDRWVKTRRSGR
jgi:ribose transport system permease protein